MPKDSRRQDEHGQYEYLVKWKGFDHDQDSWEPRDSFINTDLVDEYDRMHVNGEKRMEPESWVVERLIDHRVTKLGSYEYLVKWRDYDHYSNTWEPRESFIDKTICNEFDRNWDAYHAQQVVQGLVKNRETFGQRLVKNRETLVQGSVKNHETLGEPRIPIKNNAAKKLNRTATSTKLNRTTGLKRAASSIVPSVTAKFPHSMAPKYGLIFYIEKKSTSVEKVKATQQSTQWNSLARIEDKMQQSKVSKPPSTNVISNELRSDSTCGSTSSASTHYGMDFRGLNSAVCPIESNARCDGPKFKIQNGQKIANIKGLLKIEQKQPPISNSMKRAYETVIEYADGFS